MESNASDFDKWKCSVTKNTYYFEQVCNLIKLGNTNKPNGIVVEPDYQREYKFNKEKESSIIESLLLNIPIPIIYLSLNTEKDNVLLNVIDGSHRLRAMYRYRNNQYSLTKLKILKDLEGIKYDNLPLNIKNKLDYKTQINVEIIDVSKNEELEYEVFTRFNQSTNPLSKQELNEVIYRSEFSLWVKEELIEFLYKKPVFVTMFKCTEKRRKDKTINYYLYSCLGYAYSGLIEGKNDTPFYVERFMNQMKKVRGKECENKKIKIKDFILGLLEFYRKISFIEDIESIFSKEFITKEKPEGNHGFLISFLIPLTLIYDYLLFKGVLKRDLSDDNYHEIYNLIVKGMKAVKFGEFGGISSTSYHVQKKCIDSVKSSISHLKL
ncbi:DUF262 domain-containing protein [Clostridium felsineum]|uniref:DUF262 domain-containing protein n=1 Tax=Clostridium felsineum TaxID=36839 RepID=UPI00214D3ED5|nr:DUF262 domain-containing protein [Clostridium felsineum]MCR3761277.1 DUF262 domain-containing protein [Clostridium felsineum]